MFNNFVLKLSWRFFTSRKSERFVSFISMFSLLGIAIGVAALIVVMSVMNGFHTELTRNIIGLNGDIAILPFNNTINNYSEINELLSTKKYIKHQINSIQGQALALGPRTTNGVIIRGFKYEDLHLKNNLLNKVLAGSFNEFGGIDVIAVGNELALNLGIKINSKLRLVSSNSLASAFGNIPRSKEFRVIAVFSSGVYDYDSVTILMPLKAAQVFSSYGDNINLIEIYTDNAGEAYNYANDINNNLNGEFRVSSWQTSNIQFLNALKTERVAMFTILSLIIIVAAFNIISSLFMLVKDKVADIAILKTIGASTNQIMLIFVCNGMINGILGTILGVILGTSFASNIENIRKLLEKITGIKIFEAAIYMLYALPSELHLNDIIFITLLALGLSMAATIYPAYKAARLNPIEALRYE